MAPVVPPERFAPFAVGGKGTLAPVPLAAPCRRRDGDPPRGRAAGPGTLPPVREPPVVDGPRAGTSLRVAPVLEPSGRVPPVREAPFLRNTPVASSDPAPFTAAPFAAAPFTAAPFTAPFVEPFTAPFTDAASGAGTAASEPAVSAFGASPIAAAAGARRVIVGGAAAACSSLPLSEGVTSGNTVRTGNGALPRTTTVPRSIRRSRASRPTASRVGPVATPYSIQRGPSTPTNTEVAPPVVACSSRPHSPVNDRTRAPPSRSDASISVARSGHNPPVRGAASALTDSRPSGTVTWTAWMRPAVLGSTETVPPAGTGTRTAPKSTVPGAGVISGESVSPSCGPFVGMRMRWVARLSPPAGAATAAPRLRATRRPPHGGDARPSSRSPRRRARRQAGALPRRTWRAPRAAPRVGRSGRRG